MPHVRLIAGGGSAARRALKKLLASLEASGVTGVSRQDGGEWSDLLSRGGGGLFGGKSAVVVENAEKLGELDKKFAPLLEPEGASSEIILLCKSEAASGIPKALRERVAVIKAAEPSPWSRERDDAAAEAAREFGAGIKRDALDMLKELYSDMGELESETAKLAALAAADGRKQIERSDVEALCMNDGEREMLRLLDGLCAGRAAETLAALAGARRGSPIIVILTALHNRMRAAHYFAAYPRDAAAFETALGLSRHASDCARSAASVYGHENLLRFMTGLIALNASERSDSGTGWSGLELLLIELLASVRPR